MKLRRVLGEGTLPSFHGELRAAAARVVGWGIAEEVVQDCYLKELRADKDRRNLRTWMKRIVYNLAVDRLRQELRHEEVAYQYVYESGHEVTRAPDGAVGDADLIDGDMLDPEQYWILSEEVQSCVASLTPTQRIVLTLVEMWGFTQEEVAQELGVSQPAISRTQSRARSRLATCLNSSSPY